MCSAILLTSQKSAFRAPFMTSATPDCLEITAGMLNWAASRADRPKGSDTEGMQ